jgi:hypothetical protein
MASTHLQSWNGYKCGGKKSAGDSWVRPDQNVAIQALVRKETAEGSSKLG